MEKILKIFKRDIKRILTNPIAIIVTLGVCVIPSLYAWFNIAANWDPYSNTKDIPIAIINEDKGTTTDTTGYINAGDKIVEKLKENDALQWHFVSEDEALAGVRSGAYYAAIEIGPDFSSDLASVTEGKIHEPKLIYYVNEKKNAIAPKVTDTGATTIERQVNSEFIATVAQVVSENINGAFSGIVTKENQTRISVMGTLNQIDNDLSTLSKNLNDSKATFESTREALEASKQSLASISATTQAASRALSQADSVMETTRTDVESFQKSASEELAGVQTNVSNVAVDANMAIANALVKLQTAQQEINTSINRLEGLITTQKSARDKLQNILDNLPATDTTRDFLQDQINKLNDTIAQEENLIDSLKNDAKAITDSINNLIALNGSANSNIQNTIIGIGGLFNTLNATSMSKTSSILDTISSKSGTIQGILTNVTPAIEQTNAILDQLISTLNTADKSCSNTLTGVEDIQRLIESSKNDLSAVQSSQSYKTLKDILNLNEAEIVSFMKSPVEIKDEVVFPVANYGTGVTPFYTNLALWVGGFVLVAIYKLEVDEEEIGTYKPREGYFGRALLLVLLGQIQAIICCVGDLFMGIQCVSPTAFVFAGMVASFVYVNFIYALSIAFKHIGKALCVLMIILQIPGSSGMYPIEMMPMFFRRLYPWLPFTYGINAMRESIAGFYDGYYIINLIYLMLFLIPVLIVGIGLRKYLLNINALFDRKLAQTDMMISERVGLDSEHIKVSTLIKTAMEDDAHRGVLTQRAARFELMYPTLIKRGFYLMFIIPITLLLLMFFLKSKLPLLILWIISIILIYTFLIVIEYIHDRIKRTTNLSKLSQEELYTLLGKQMKQDYMSFAPLEKVLHSKSPEEFIETAKKIREARENQRAQKDHYVTVEHTPVDDDEDAKKFTLFKVMTPSETSMKLVVKTNKDDTEDTKDTNSDENIIKSDKVESLDKSSSELSDDVDETIEVEEEPRHDIEVVEVTEKPEGDVNPKSDNSVKSRTEDGDKVSSDTSTSSPQKPKKYTYSNGYFVVSEDNRPSKDERDNTDVNDKGGANDETDVPTH